MTKALSETVAIVREEVASLEEEADEMLHRGHDRLPPSRSAIRAAVRAATALAGSGAKWL